MREGVERWMGQRGLMNGHGRAIFQEEYRSNQICCKPFSSSEDEEFTVMKNDYKKVFSISNLDWLLVYYFCLCSWTEIDFEFVRNGRWFWLFRITHTTVRNRIHSSEFYSDRELLSDTWRINEILLIEEWEFVREKRRARVARRFFVWFTIYHERGDMLLFRMNRENLNEVKIHSFLVSTMNTNYKRWVISNSRKWSRQKTFSSSSCVALLLRKWKIFITKENEWKSIFIILLCSTEKSGKKANKQQTVQVDGNGDDNDFVVK